ncbi:alpha/beta hydrolase [Thiorhodovibrio frisius]|uniref:Lysophospholipase n=1 Tax=Thiorhodovibrio frisius TaxID=631362 RepID=H8Z180_9GAMM|nr:alpha/beta fold hydrolase [Thiorhodovibrio frisius]EIC21395.1 lysophospholipase [Thiorhodovibrio frisius]WPL23981.1 acetoin dehydrogenase E2 subunit dihydrolipoyllysine-residue acetyltransferase [Thiorhodovibrio frisius]
MMPSPFQFASLAAGLILAWLLFHLAIQLGFRAKRLPEQSDPGTLGLPFATVAIPGRARKPLFGWWLPAENSRRSVIILHGWGSNAEQMLPLALPLHGGGYNVLLFDARNHGRSPGATFSSLPRFAEDLDAAITWLQANQSDAAASITVIGHSVGAGAALFSASRRNDLAAVVSLSTFAHPRWVTARYLRQIRLPSPVIALVARYVEWVIGHRFETIAPVNTIKAIPCPVLLVHGDADRAVPITDAQMIAQSGAPGGLELLVIPGGDHDSSEHIPEYSPRLLAFLAAAEQQQSYCAKREPEAHGPGQPG